MKKKPTRLDYNPFSQDKDQNFFSKWMYKQKAFKSLMLHACETGTGTKSLWSQASSTSWKSFDGVKLK